MDTVKCDICGKEVAPRGLVGHQKSNACLAVKAAMANNEDITEPITVGSNHREPTGSDRLEEKRKRRKAYNGKQLKMTVEANEGMKNRWVNEENIETRKAQGYEFVHDKKKVGEGESDNNESLGNMTSMQVSKDGKMAYLMEIEAEFYEEDQAKKQAEIDESDRMIHKGQFKNNLGDKGYSEVNIDGNRHSSSGT